MKIELNVSNTALAEYVLRDGEVVTQELLTSVLLAARETNAFNVDVIVPVTSTDRELLESNGFLSAGFLTFGHPHQETYIRYRHGVRIAGEGYAAGSGATLAVPMPIIAPTAEEVTAAELVRARYGSPLSDARLAELAAMGRQLEPEAKPDPIMDRLRAEISRLESEL